jgi:hypothetical protein
LTAANGSERLAQLHIKKTDSPPRRRTKNAVGARRSKIKSSPSFSPYIAKNRNTIAELPADPIHAMLSLHPFQSFYPRRLVKKRQII